MATIVSGFATAHSPLLTLGAEEWIHRAKADHANPRLNLSDGRRVTYEQLLAEVGPRYEQDVTVEKLTLLAAACETALDRLADALEESRPDLVIIVGDDQGELFSSANQPAFSIFHGASAQTLDKIQDRDPPGWQRTIVKGYLMDQVHELTTAPEFALELIKGLVDQGVDVASCDRVEDPLKAGFGHAYGFVVQRLFRGRKIPIVPVMLNTYFPPNVPTAARCYDIGRAMRQVIEAMPGNARVAIIASGGLSHFIVDEPLDRGVLKAIEDKDAVTLRSLPRGALQSGSSEILNWILTAGAMEGLNVRSCDYYPLRRTPAGTGVGAGFLAWG